MVKILMFMFNLTANMTFQRLILQPMRSTVKETSLFVMFARSPCPAQNCRSTSSKITHR